MKTWTVMFVASTALCAVLSVLGVSEVAVPIVQLLFATFVVMGALSLAGLARRPQRIAQPVRREWLSYRVRDDRLQR
jgi:hypothetical protein